MSEEEVRIKQFNEYLNKKVTNSSITIKESIDTAYRATKSKDVGIINDYVNEITTAKNKREEAIKQVISNHVQKIYNEAYKTEHGTEDIDMILWEKAIPDKVSLWEIKAPSNSNEMITIKDFNKKAFWEAIANYIIYREEHKDKDIRTVVITNGNDWFIVSGDAINIIFNRDDFRREVGFSEKDVMTLFKTDITKKAQIYDAMKEHFKHEEGQEKIKEIRARTFYFQVPANGTSNSKTHEGLFYLLSPVYLLGKNVVPKTTVVNKKFYGEILYIMGLKEVKVDNKMQILPDEEAVNSFYWQLKDKVKKKLKEKNGTNVEDKEVFETSLGILIKWFNRILFLNLFESQLKKFNGNSEEFRILAKNKISDFALMNNLFFEVMAVKPEKRDESLDVFKNIPYLNSSLFEESVEEIVEISVISPTSELKLYKETVVTEKSDKLPLLDYLLKFLDAYDFGGNEESGKEIISPAILGLIFEKINGYKDGSYYTPTEITNYMADEAIKRALLNRVKKEVNLDYSSYEELKGAFFRLTEEERNKIREIIKDLKICDPAVGSAHFLVSALDVLLTIWYDFQVGDFGTIDYSKYGIKFVGDTVVPFKYDEYFSYKREKNGGMYKVDEEDQKFQETLFNSRRYIIENCLFGADINPKAVDIARLRLWIELLKNAYYKKETEFTEMETLPNIDINIKVGDSLLAPIIATDITETLSDVAVKEYIPEYKELIAKYQNEPDKDKKDELKKKIQVIRDEIKGKLIRKMSEKDKKLSESLKKRGKGKKQDEQGLPMEELAKEGDKDGQQPG